MRGREGSRPLSSSGSQSTTTDWSSPIAQVLALLGLALPQRLQSCVREFEGPKIEVRSIPCLLARCGYQSGRKRLVPLKSKTRQITNDSPQLLLRNISGQWDCVESGAANRRVSQQRI